MMWIGSGRSVECRYNIAPGLIRPGNIAVLLQRTARRREHDMADKSLGTCNNFDLRTQPMRRVPQRLYEFADCGAAAEFWLRINRISIMAVEA